MATMIQMPDLSGFLGQVLKATQTQQTQGEKKNQDQGTLQNILKMFGSQSGSQSDRGILGILSSVLKLFL